MKKVNTFAALVLLPAFCNAQNTGGDYLDNIGKIYVVVGVLLILFLAIIGFLFLLERRVKKMEEQLDLDENY